MKRKERYTHNAKYPLFGFMIPCYWHEETEDICAKFKLLDPLLDFAVWIDFEFGEGFKYWIGTKIKLK